MRARGLLLGLVLSALAVSAASVFALEVDVEENAPLERVKESGEIPNTDAVVYGMVVDAKTLEPIENAYVRLSGTFATDEDGQYAANVDAWSGGLESARRTDGSLNEDYALWPPQVLHDVHAGRYPVSVRISVRASGYIPFEGEVPSLRPGARERLDIGLEPRPERKVDEASLWREAKQNAGGAVVLRPGWLPEGFEVSDVFDRGDHGTPFETDNPKGSDVQYGRGESSIIIGSGLGDLGEASAQDVVVRGNAGRLATYNGGAILVWTEKVGERELWYCVEAIGSDVSPKDVLRVAQSLIEY
jgi:hypothetical protein